MINMAILAGNVGRDPDIRSLQSGDKVANFSLATSEHWTDKASGEKRERTTWHRIVVFGPLVNVVEKYVRKGTPLFVQGAIAVRKYTDSAGAERESTEITLQGFNSVLRLMGGKPEGGTAEPASKPASKPAARKQLESTPPIDDDDIPF
jgi:single-strand DNA-binding protein